MSNPLKDQTCAIVIERGPRSYGAYVPDLPRCVAVGESRAEVCGLIREAIELYIEQLEADGQPVPAPQAYELIEVKGVWRTQRWWPPVYRISGCRWQGAQSEERRTRIAEVVGSNPIRSTTTLHDGRRFGAVV